MEWEAERDKEKRNSKMEEANEMKEERREEGKEMERVRDEEGKNEGGGVRDEEEGREVNI